MQHSPYRAGNWPPSRLSPADEPAWASCPSRHVGPCHRGLPRGCGVPANCSVLISREAEASASSWPSGSLSTPCGWTQVLRPRRRPVEQEWFWSRLFRLYPCRNWSGEEGGTERQHCGRGSPPCPCTPQLPRSSSPVSGRCAMASWGGEVGATGALSLQEATQAKSMDRDVISVWLLCNPKATFAMPMKVHAISGLSHSYHIATRQSSECGRPLRFTYYSSGETSHQYVSM